MTPEWIDCVCVYAYTYIRYIHVYIRILHICFWVVTVTPAYIWTSRIARMNEPCPTYEWALSHIYMSHVTHMHGPYRTYAWNLPHTWMRHDKYMHESCHTYAKSCHTYEEVMSHINLWLLHECDRIPICVNMSHLCVWHNFFIRVTWHVTRMKKLCHT